MQRLFFLTASILFLWQNLYAQKLIVKDSETNQPLPFVTFSDSEKKTFVSADLHGFVDISSLSSSASIEVRLLGYKTLFRSYDELSRSSTLLLTKRPFDLNPIVISASRWEQRKEEVPQRIVSISKKDVQFFNPQTSADLLETSGAVFIQKSQQGGGSPMIRGFSTNRLLYSVDGVRMNTAIFRSGNLQNVISLDAFTMEKTEVLFGPGSVIYGSDAIGGVMSFSTLSPQLSSGDSLVFNGNTTLRFNTANNEKTAHLDLGWGWKKWGFISSATFSDFGDLKMGSNGPDDYTRPFFVERRNGEDLVIENNNKNIQRTTTYSQKNWMQKIQFKPSESWNFDYGFHYSETSEYDRYDRLTQIRNNTLRYAEWKYGPQIWMMNNLSITHSQKNQLYDQMNIRLAHQFFEESRISRSLNDSIRSERTEKVNAFSTNFDFTKKKQKHQLFYGIEAIYDQVDSKGKEVNILSERSINGQSRYPDSDWFSFAIYASDHISLSNKWSLGLGLRYSHFLIESSFDTALFPLPFNSASFNNGSINGNVGLVYKPRESLVFSSNLSTGYRAPNVDDIGKIFDSEPSSVVIPNPDLQSEYAYNIDLSVAHIINDFIKVDLTAYSTLLENALVRRDFKLDGKDSILYEGELSKVQAIQNAAKAIIYGFQLDVDVKLSSHFTLKNTANFQKGEEEMDDGSISPSRHVAPFFGTCRLDYEQNKLKVQVYLVYNGEISHKNLNIGEQDKTNIFALDSNGDTYSPSWYTLNVKSRYQFNKSFAVNAGIENITNQRYRTYSSGIAAAGINFVLSANVNF